MSTVRFLLRIVALAGIAFVAFAAEVLPTAAADGCGYSCDVFDFTFCISMTEGDCNSTIDAFCLQELYTLGGPDCVRACGWDGECEDDTCPAGKTRSTCDYGPGGGN
jgi:hypothetical protein